MAEEIDPLWIAHVEGCEKEFCSQARKLWANYQELQVVNLAATLKAQEALDRADSKGRDFILSKHIRDLLEALKMVRGIGES